MTRLRPTRAEIDPAAISANVGELVRFAAPAAVCAVVKGDGYGHGAVTAARAAIAGGATWLAVALVEEAVTLRAAGVDVPILVLSEPPPDAWPAVIETGVEVTVYSAEVIDAAAAAGASAQTTVGLHLKVDTGMHRVGCRPDEAVGLAQRIAGSTGTALAGVFTHLATAEEGLDGFASVQLDRYRSVLDELSAVGIESFLRHASNSAGLLAIPEARLDLVRCGIACYGVPPAPSLADVVDLQPAMRLVSDVVHVQRLDGDEPVSYGGVYRTTRPTTIATVPIGYADGVPRSLGRNGGVALVRGHRVPVVGNVTMDQLMLDVGDLPVRRGDEVVFVGSQGRERITADEVAEREGSIGYEIVTRIGARVPREVVVDGQAPVVDVTGASNVREDARP